MPKTIEALWRALETDAAAGKTGTRGWLLRLARPDADCLLFVGLELTSRRRAVLLRLPSTSMPSRRLWPRCKGLDPLALEVEGKAHFGVALKEPRFADVFAALAEDLMRRVGEAATPREQANTFLGQLSRWQKFLSASQEGLTEEQQRGLWGELNFLRKHLLGAFGPAAVAGWKGGEKAHQDFQFPTGAVEVKTTLAKQPQVVRITSERQLDDSSYAVLFLQVTALDAREGGGETLPRLVALLRERLSGNATAQERFEDVLLAAGFLDAHAERYTERGYLVRKEKLFRVRRGFPRLVERDLPTGVGDTNYRLSVAACEKFSATASEMLAALGRSAKQAAGGKK